jgi:hypothetical protein
MAYAIYKSDGTLVTVPDNAIDSTFYNPTANGAGKGLGTQLVGRNAIDYGAPVAQTFLQLTENFCGTVLPSDSTALQGQLWFNKTSGTDGVLYVRNSAATSGGLANWKQVVTIPSGSGRVAVVNPASGTEQDGDIRVVGAVISMLAAGAWRQIFPAVYS